MKIILFWLFIGIIIGCTIGVIFTSLISTSHFSDEIAIFMDKNIRDFNFISQILSTYNTFINGELEKEDFTEIILSFIKQYLKRE